MPGAIRPPGTLPVPDDLRAQVEQAQRLGVTLYLHDKAAAIGADVMLAHVPLAEKRGLDGYLAVRESDDSGRPLDSWLVFYYTASDPAEIIFRVRVPMRPGRRPMFEEHDPPILADGSVQLLIRARRTALVSLRAQPQPTNTVILPGSVVGHDGVLVYLLAGTIRSNMAVFGKHYRVLVSPDGSQIVRLEPLSKTIIETPLSPPDLRAGAKVSALTVSHIVTEYPLETHVFVSLLHKTPVYVATARGTWFVDGHEISLVRGNEPASPPRVRGGQGEPCPCGSGAPFKRCHGEDDTASNSDDETTAAGSLPEPEQLEAEVARLHREGDVDAAIPFAKRALEIREQELGPEHPLTATSLDNLANLYSAKGDFANAEPLLLRALPILEKALGPDHPGVAAPLKKLAALYLERGDYLSAEPLCQRALTIEEKALGPEHLEVGTSLHNLARVYEARGDDVKAEPLYQRALAIREDALWPARADLARSLKSLAELYSTRGDHGKAEPLYRRALKACETTLGPEHPTVAVLLSSLAELYGKRGDHGRASRLFQRALSMAERWLGHDDAQTAELLHNLAASCRREGDHARAESFYQRALSIREKALGSAHPHVNHSLNGLAMLYMAQGDLAKAEPLFQRALATTEKVRGSGHPDVVISLNNLALLYQANGDYRRAELLQRRVVDVLEKALGPEHPNLAASQNRLAVLAMARGDVPEATRWMERAAAIEDHHANVRMTAGSHEQNRAYMDTLRATTYGAVSLHVQFAPHAQDARRLALTTILRRKGCVLDAMADSLTALRRRLSAEDRAVLDQLRSVGAELSLLTWRGSASTPVAYYCATLAKLEEERQLLEAKVSLRSVEARAEFRPVTIEQLQEAIPDGTALVELFRYEPLNPRAARPEDRWGAPRYVAHVLHREGEIAWVDLGEAAVIELAVERFRLALGRPSVAQEQVARDLDEELCATASLHSAARELDSLVMQPVRGLLGSTRRILLSPDGDLNLVPFGALIDEEGRYLIERHAVTYLASGRDLLRLATATPSRQGPVVVAAPDYRAAPEAADTTEAHHDRRSAEVRALRFHPLRFAAEEGRAVARKLPGATLLLGAAATEEAVKAVRGPLVLHIATHGFFLPDQPALHAPPSWENDVRLRGLGEGAPSPLLFENTLLRTGLALAGANRRYAGHEDGMLTALELSQIDLTGTKLVVLSACQTGVGEVRSGDGVYGLRRAVTIAGAETQAMSLWSVDDAATSDLMQAYYDGLLAGGGRGEALRQAQLAMLSRPDRAHPYHWASFIVSGNPGTLDGRPVEPDFTGDARLHVEPVRASTPGER